MSFPFNFFGFYLFFFAHRTPMTNKKRRKKMEQQRKRMYRILTAIVYAADVSDTLSFQRHLHRCTFAVAGVVGCYF